MKHLILLFLISVSFAGCQISLFPPTYPSQKYVLPISEAEVDFSKSDCRNARVFLSEIKVAEYMRSAKIRFETKGIGELDAEVKALESFEWASSFEGIFRASFESGLRRAFVLNPGISFLSQASSAASDIEIGVSLIRISMEADGDNAKLSGELSLRVFDVNTGAEDYILVRSERPTAKKIAGKVMAAGLDDETQIFSAIQKLISGLFKESYQTIGDRLCVNR